MRHVIGKQLVELTLSPQEKDAFQLQHQFSSMYWNDIVPAMERLFDQLSTTEEVLVIDHLEIDLGQITVADLGASQFIPLLKRALEKWFQENKMAVSSNQSKPVERNIFEKWLYFLAHGYLPWNSKTMPKNSAELLLQSLTTHPADQQQLAQLLTNNRQALQRLVLQHDTGFLGKVLEAYTGKPSVGLIDFIENQVNLPQKGNRSYRDHKTDFWTFAIEQTVLKQKQWSDETLIRAYQTHLEKEEKLKRIDEKTVEKNGHPSNIATKPDVDDIYIHNAGIILLHPFLTRFFEHCGLLENKAFKDHQAASKAIHLMHYMSTNTEQPAEYDLSLMKFLCGIPLNVPIEKYLELSKEEKEEADALLQAAIQHWGALGKVSNASLQEVFLQREGKLLQEQSGWRLQIEKKTVDILLDQLPWTISIIKLPWMKEFLKTDWI